MTLYVTEYAYAGMVPNNAAQMPYEPPIADYTVPPGSASPSFQAATRMVRVHTDAICSVLFGPPGTTATTTNGRMAANQTEYRGVPEGRGFVVAVVANT